MCSSDLTLTGTLNRREFQPGDTLRLDATLRMASGVLAGVGAMRAVATLTLERLTQTDGFATWGDSQFASALSTPTGFPIERWTLFRRDGLAATITQTISRPAPDRAEMMLNLALPLPSDLPPGLYRPYVVVRIEDDQGRFLSLPPETPPRGRRELTATTETAWLPLVQVGNPAPPRLPWLLLADTVSNGSRAFAPSKIAPALVSPPAA